MTKISGIAMLAWVLGDAAYIAIFSQTQPAGVDGLAGSAGWVGTGLLGLVLAWLLLTHLPAKDKQLKEFVDSKDALAKEIAASQAVKMLEMSNMFSKQVESIMSNVENANREKRQDFKENLDRVIAHCREENSVLHQSLKDDLANSDRVISDLRITLEELRVTMLKIQKAIAQGDSSQAGTPGT